jgi:glycolate oxidase
VFRVAAGGAAAVEVMVAADDEEAAWLRGLRTMAYPAFERMGRVLLDDVCVPVRALPRLVTGIERVAAEHDVLIGTFGHAGDGNLHPTIVVPRDDEQRAQDAFAAVVRLAQALGGTCTGEHGVGNLKLPFLPGELDPGALRLMGRVRDAFDPTRRLNPGKGS